MNSANRIILAALLLGLVIFSSGCASSRSENGVTIEKNRSLNPFDYIPDIPGI